MKLIIKEGLIFCSLCDKFQACICSTCKQEAIWRNNAIYCESCDEKLAYHAETFCDGINSATLMKSLLSKIDCPEYNNRHESYRLVLSRQVKTNLSGSFLPVRNNFGTDSFIETANSMMADILANG